MLLPLATFILVTLSAAAPVTEDPAFSQTLAKRAPRCLRAFGHDIGLTDCVEALFNMNRLPQFREGRGEGLFSWPTSEFSRTATDSRFRLPQQIKVGTCTIFLDISSNMHRTVVMRSAVSLGAQDIVSQCVLPQRIGGSDTRFGIETAVGSEQTLDPSLRAAWEQCKLLSDNVAFDDRAQCLLHDLEVEAEAAAQQRARGPNVHSTS